MSKPREWAWYPRTKADSGRYMTGELSTDLGQKHAAMILVEKRYADELAEALKILLKQHRYNVIMMDCDDDKKVLADVEKILGKEWT